MIVGCVIQIKIFSGQSDEQNAYVLGAISSKFGTDLTYNPRTNSVHG